MKRIFIFLLLSINANFAFGYIIDDVLNGCDNPYYMLPMFEINQYNCASGYYLPAGTYWQTNNDGCKPCPNNATCVGGIYAYDENNDQGIKYNSFIPNEENAVCNAYYSYMLPRFERNQYTCDAGYYLPADSIECVICPNDSYCVGGTYAFNENVMQGIVSCGTGLYSPSGMWESAQCGRILHVGGGFVYLRSTKKTEHALHVDLNLDGVADFFGNMTPLDVPMTRGTEQRLKVRMNDVVYSIYDDSVELSLYSNEF